ncbi:O-antigen polymerase [Oceanobacillus oncorhynchi subsp. oncorhynchi]|uniref:O-antigen polymerase n=1 Tax=Oceanobacillus oncorhynchi TaxID=545501 RepID=UPI00362D1C62
MNIEPFYINLNRILVYLFISILTTVFIINNYNSALDYNSLLFIILIPIIIAPFFFSKDLMNPFVIFFLNSQFLFVLNMIDVNINKSSFRYGILSSNYHDKAFFWSIIVILIWFVFLYLGYFYSVKITSQKSKLDKVSKVNNKLVISLILILIGLGSYLYIVFLKGGIDEIIDGLSNRTEAYSGLNYFVKLIALISIGSIMMLSIGYKKTSMVLILLSFLMLSSFGGRAGAFFGSIFPYIIYYNYKVKKIRLIQLIPLGLIMIIFATALGNYRLYQKFSFEMTGIKDIFLNIANGTQGGETLPSLIGSLMNRTIDYEYGSTIINILFAPIPRTLWRDKPPIDESGIVGRLLMGAEGWGLPPGPYGIAFLNFGFIGVLVVSFITGFIVYYMYSKLVLNNKNDIFLIFYAMTIPSIFNIVSTSAQINLLWYVGVFIFIKLLDIILTMVKKDKRSLKYLKTEQFYASISSK